MRVNLRTVVAIETALLVILVGFLAVMGFRHDFTHENMETYDLLSPKIKNDIMEEKSFSVVNFAPLRANLEQYIVENDAQVSVYIENLRNGAYTGIDERAGFLPASLNKLPLAILIMRKVESGELRMDTPIKIEKSDRLNTYGTLYLSSSTELPLSIMLEELLGNSDNTAFSSLLHYVSPQDIEFILDYYGLDISLDFPETALEEHTNTISPKSMSNLFSSLYFSTVLSAENSEYLLSLMENNAFDVHTLADLPSSVRISHKFGEHNLGNISNFHDCGIMYIEEKRYFYCVMSQDDDLENAKEHTLHVINAAYQYIEWANKNYEKLKT